MHDKVAPTEVLVNDHYTLPFEDYKKWYFALIEDQCSVVENVLNSEKSELLLKGKFVYKRAPKLLAETRNDKRPPFEITKPLCLAVAFGAQKNISVFNQNELADFLTTDVNGKS